MSYVDQADDQTPQVNLGTAGRTQTAEVPVNPYSLLEAVNASSAAARGGWVIFLAICTFILVAVAGVTHRDLLLNTKVDLPILQVEIELTRFFLFAPMLLLFVHFGMLIQHVMLSRKTLEFDRSLRAMEVTRRPAHPLRLELHSYFFTQALAGPHRGWLLAGFLHAMIWISLVVLPVLIMLFTQIVFLPYHNEFITWVHRIVLLLDMTILLAVGVFLRRTEASFIGALMRVARNYPVNFLFTGTLFAIILLLSFFVATIPGERLDTLRPTLESQATTQQLSDSSSGASGSSLRATADALSSTRDLLKDILDTLVSRDLIVSDTDLVSDKEDASGEVSIVLRGRDLRNATLDRSDLHRADLSGADLRGASLVGTDLRNARLVCEPEDENTAEDPDTSTAIDSDDEDQNCTRLQNSNLTEAKLQNADLTGARLDNAILQDAKLVGADLNDANLTGADLNYADLRKVNLSGGVKLFGANLTAANLRGAYLSGANLHGADLTSATLDGAIMRWVNAMGAIFQGAKLQGAYLSGAQLQGAVFDGATMTGADLSNAAVWQTTPPKSSAFSLIDTTDLALQPMSDLVRQSVIDAGKLKMGENAKKRLATLLTNVDAERKDAGPDWSNVPHYLVWQKFIARGAQNAPNYKSRITDFLGKLACQQRWRDGAVADGVVRRALETQFAGEIAQIERQISDPSCPASKTVSPDLKKKIVDAIEERSNPLSEAQTGDTAATANNAE